MFKKSMTFLFSNRFQLSYVEVIAIHVLIFNAVGGFEFIKSVI
jgi:hypothetical protein